MISPSDFIQGLFPGDFGAIRHRHQTPGRGSRRINAVGIQKQKWADLMATSGQFYWPSMGSSVAAYGQFSMAANTRLPESFYYLAEMASCFDPIAIQEVKTQPAKTASRRVAPSHVDGE